MRIDRPGLLFIMVLLSSKILITAEDEPERIVITAEAEPADPRSVSSQVTVVTEEEIKASGARNAGEVLASVVGVQTVRYGGLTQPVLVSIRGSSPEQVLVLVDGKRLNSAQGGGVDFSTINPDDIERIEVIRGGASALYGENALGGVVNIIMKDGAGEDFALAVKGSVGSLETCEGGGQIQGGFNEGKGNYFFSLSALRTGGSYTYANEHEDDGTAEFVNSDGSSLNGSIKTGYHISSSLQLNLNGQYHLDEKGVPGTVEFPSENARMADHRFVTGGGVLWDTPMGAWEGSLSIIKQTRHYEDPDFYLGAVDDFHDNTALSGELLWSREDVFSRFSLSQNAGYSLRGDSLQSSALIKSSGLSEGDGTVSRIQHSLYYRSQWGFFPREEGEPSVLSLFPALRYDWSRVRFDDEDLVKTSDAPSWNLGINISVDRQQKIVLKGNGGYSYRAPSFDDLFWPSSSFAVGNPDLEPEEALIFDGGVLLKPLTWMSLEAVYFYHDVTNLIQWNPGAFGQWRPRNLASARIQGFEGECSLLIDLSFMNCYSEVKGNMTLLYAFDTTEDSVTYGMFLPRRAPYQFNGIVSLNHYDGHFIRLEGRAVSPRYITAQNTKYLEGYFILDLNVNAQIRENWYVNMAVKNLLNQSYVDIQDYPVPGVEFYVGTGWNYKPESGEGKK